MTKTHKNKSNQRLNWKQRTNLDNGMGSGLNGWSAADVDEGETLEEMAIVKLLGSSLGLKNSHANFRSTGHAITWRHADLRETNRKKTKRNPVNKGE
jgi:hypothetical protein